MNRKATEEGIFRTIREMLIHASPAEVKQMAPEAHTDVQSLAEISKKAFADALARHQGTTESVVPMHKGLSSFLVLLRRRDGIDEQELATKADVEEVEIRRIEFDPGYVPSPRTVYRLEQAFSLPPGVLAKLTGAIKHHSSEIEKGAMRFAANAKSMGKLSKEERRLLAEFVKFLTDSR